MPGNVEAFFKSTPGKAQNQKGPEAPEKKCSGPFEKRFHGSSLAVFIVEQVALNRHVQNFQCHRVFDRLDF
jgi:hypothetical protein